MRFIQKIRDCRIVNKLKKLIQYFLLIKISNKMQQSFIVGITEPNAKIHQNHPHCQESITMKARRMQEPEWQQIAVFC